MDATLLGLLGLLGWADFGFVDFVAFSGFSALSETSALADAIQSKVSALLNDVTTDFRIRPPGRL